MSHYHVHVMHTPRGIWHECGSLLTLSCSLLFFFSLTNLVTYSTLIITHIASMLETKVIKISLTHNKVRKENKIQIMLNHKSTFTFLYHFIPISPKIYNTTISFCYNYYYFELYLKDVLLHFQNLYLIQHRHLHDYIKNNLNVIDCMYLYRVCVDIDYAFDLKYRCYRV